MGVGWTRGGVRAYPSPPRIRDDSRNAPHARMALTTLPDTSVRRKSRPWNGYVSRLVIDAQQVQHRGVQVVDVDDVLDGVVAELVGGAVGDAAP